jgi:hypothetical protein
VFLTYLYLLRVPVLAGLVLAVFPIFALGSRGEALFAGLFDLSWWGTAVAAFLALMAAAAVGICIELVLRYASERCLGVAPPSEWMRAVALPIGRLDLRRYTLINAAFALAFVLPMLLALPLTRVSALSRSLRVTAVAAAFTIFAAGLAAAFVVWLKAGSRSRVWLGRLLAWSPDGYLDRSQPPLLLPGHGFAVVAVLAFLLVYTVFGLGKLAALTCEANSIAPCTGLAAWEPSTLACLLALLTLACYAGAGVTFFIDRFRVPLLATAAVLLMLGQDWPGADYYYDVTPAPTTRTAPPEPSAILARAGDTAVVVAASGGGIHAAAWTAAVLSRLALDSPQQFTKQLRLVSAVSGGSVGTMHVVDAMRRKVFDAVPKRAAFDPAARSSLDDIAWGLTYPDLLRLAVPFVSLRDRGWAAEHAWARGNPDLREPLRSWEQATAAGALPAIIFNATLEETGGRLMITTSNIPVPRGPGRVTFRELYSEHDIAVVTAARLSSTFPIVSPAARIGAWVPFADRYHVVDGGYYDNFGVSSLADWLEAALPGSGVRRVLVVQIRGPIAAGDAPADNARGFFHELTAPVLTLTHFRNAAQIAHNTTELRLLCRAAPPEVTIENVDFQYPESEVPLSWHLTAAQQDRVWDLAECDPSKPRPEELQRACRSIEAARRKTQAFLAGTVAGGTTQPAPLDWAGRRRACEREFGPATPVMPLEAVSAASGVALRGGERR